MEAAGLIGSSGGKEGRKRTWPFDVCLDPFSTCPSSPVVELLDLVISGDTQSHETQCKATKPLSRSGSLSLSLSLFLTLALSLSFFSYLLSISLFSPLYTLSLSLPLSLALFLSTVRLPCQSDELTLLAGEPHFPFFLQINFPPRPKQANRFVSIVCSCIAEKAPVKKQLCVSFQP